MKGTAAVFVAKGRVELKSFEYPDPAPDEVLVKTLACSICGSDIERIFGERAVPGVVVGHEWVGEVVKIGRDVPRLKAGDRVVPGGGTAAPPPVVDTTHAPSYAARPKGARGRYSPWENGRYCYPATFEQGAFAQYALRKHWRLSTVPDGLSTLDAATCEPLAVAIHAARISGVALGDTVAVIGLGAIGLFVVQCLKLQGAQRIIAVDPIASRRSTALTLGATDIIDPATVDALDAIVLASGGDGPDCVVECAGAKDTLEVAVQSVRQNGTVVLLACRFVDTPIVPANWLSREPRIVGSYAYGPHGWPMAKQLLASGRVTTKGITSDRHVFPFERIQEALDRCVSRGEDVVKAILTFA